MRRGARAERERLYSDTQYSIVFKPFLEWISRRGISGAVREAQLTRFTPAPLAVLFFIYYESPDREISWRP